MRAESTFLIVLWKKSPIGSNLNDSNECFPLFFNECKHHTYIKPEIYLLLTTYFLSTQTGMSSNKTKAAFPTI